MDKAPTLIEPARNSPSKNRLLNNLPPEEYERISSQLHAVPMQARQLVHKQGERIREVYFPAGGACSITKVMEDGKIAEIATVGNEGMLGASVFFGDDVSVGETFVQVPDTEAYVMQTDAFIAEMARRGLLYNRIIRYSQAFTAQIMQTTVCNGLHPAEQRCCRWLLMTQDRVRGDGFLLHEDFLMVMLGVERSKVRRITSGLRRNGLIEYDGEALKILDRPALETASCECYETVRQTFARLLPEMPPVG